MINWAIAERLRRSHLQKKVIRRAENKAYIMKAIRFSICKSQHDALEPYEVAVESFFRADHNPVKIQVIPWDTFKQELMTMAIYGHNTDVSQIAAPLVYDLIAMNALRPFTQEEIASFGGASAFVPVAWNTIAATKEVYSIPWLVDGRAIIYWRDMLEQAGVDEATAFTSFDNLENTFECLQEKGFETPWAVGTASKYNAFQTACTWIWGLGEEISKRGEILIDHPEVIDALVRYFKLYRFMPQQEQDPSPAETWKMFEERQVAALLYNFSTHTSTMLPEKASKIGTALAPGPTYVGGSSLVVWRQSRQPDRAVELIRHLTSNEIQLEFSLLSGIMPSRVKVLNDTHFTKISNLHIFSDSILQGRSYADLYLSNLMEDLLADAIRNVWKKMIADPRTDIKSALLAEIKPIKSRMNFIFLTNVWND